MTLRQTTIAFSVAILAFHGMTGANETKDPAARILDMARLDGGLIVHVGCGDGTLTAALGLDSKFLVQGLDASAENVRQARARLRSLGRYGRVSVDTFDGRHLPYAENLVNLIVTEDLGQIPMSEVLRVLCPGGVACILRDGRWTKIVKPWPEAIDEWTHYLHGADGNPVARDTVVGPPKHYQWVAGPLWMRSHESDSSVKAMVTAKGKLFYIADEAPISLLGENPLPDKWFLTARDAFNGMPLWKVPMKDWGWRSWKPSWFTPRPGDIPLNIQKRLVAVGDRVYTTLGYRAAVSQIDAHTGAILQTYQGTERTAEILYRDGRLVLTILKDDRSEVVLLDAKTGKLLWTSEHDYGGTVTDYYRFRAVNGSVTPAKVDPTLNTATDGVVVGLLDGRDVVCLDFHTGKQKWRSEFPLVEADFKAGNINAGRTVWTGTLIVQDGAVVHASPNQLAAFAADSGKILWKQPKKYLQHLWYEWKDVFVIDGLVWTWSAELKREKLEGKRPGMSSWPATVNGYDLQTGKLVKQVPLGNIFKTHHHHRCYRNKATSRYILASRRGSEFVDLVDGQHTVDNWIRGICHLGMMPANGLQYAPPHPCSCYIDEKLNGFHALAGEIPGASYDGPPRPSLAKEAAFSTASQGHRTGLPAKPTTTEERATEADWPTFRHDAMRSGSVETSVPDAPKLLWQVRMGRKVAPPIVVGNQLFVPLVDQHHLVAVDVKDGRQQWETAAGARIDSPPTYYRGTVIFGSADGRVYCVRADDGQLVWRFHAAPRQRSIGAFDQLESPWPVHGSVLVQEGIAYFAAGRTSHLDGGIYLFGVDAATGELRHQTRIQGPSYNVDNISQNYELPMGTLPDILQGDGTSLYMREVVFNEKLQRQKPSQPPVPRVLAPGGMLDGSYFKRIPWSYGPKSPQARLVVHDGSAAYFLRMFDSLQGLDPKVFFVPGKKGYLLFAIDQQTRQPKWNRRIPVRVNTMVATEGVLFVAGPPDVVDPDDPLGAFEGRKGGVLMACNAADGEILWQRQLSTPPVFNGMAVARGRLYIALQDGSVACFGK